jgi:hypothetical protein
VSYYRIMGAGAVAGAVWPASGLGSTLARVGNLV